MDLTRGTKQPWRYNGLAVALCSAPPQQMTDGDIAIATGFYNAGIGCALKKGPFYKPGDDFRKVHKFQVANLSPRYEINTGGAGGENYSLQWPKKNLAGMKLRCRIQRSPDNRVRFEVYNADGDWSRPWWDGETTIPATLVEVPIRYVAVLTTEENPDSQTPPQPHMVVEGRVSSLQGWTGEVQPPTIASYLHAGDAFTNGQEFKVNGAGFLPGTQVFINGVACQTQVFGATELKAVAAGLVPETRNRLHVVNADGLFAYYEPGVYAGLYLAKVEPRESLPKGGDVVTVRGGGLGDVTKITFNGKPAEIVGHAVPDGVRVRGSGRRKRDWPRWRRRTPGSRSAASRSSAMPRIRTCCSRGKEGLETLRERFRDPAFANYRQAILVETDKAIAKLDDPNVRRQSGLQRSSLRRLLPLRDDGRRPVQGRTPPRCNSSATPPRANCPSISRPRSRPAARPRAIPAGCGRTSCATSSGS